jgi:hypothetical protein
VIHHHKLLYLLAIFVVLGLAACDTPPTADPPTTSEADTAVILLMKLKPLIPMWLPLKHPKQKQKGKQQKRPFRHRA